jgi:hypothetical protein
MTILTEDLRAGSSTAASAHTVFSQEDISGPPGRMTRVVVTAYNSSGNVALGTSSDGWTRLWTFGPTTANLQATTQRATTAVFQKADPGVDEDLVVTASLDSTFAVLITHMDPSED